VDAVLYGMTCMTVLVQIRPEVNC